MTAPVGVGLVGFGMAATSLHVPLIAAEPGLALRAVVSSDPAKVRLDVPVVSTVDALLADPAVELVVVAAPTGAHTTRSPPPRCGPGGTWWWTSRSPRRRPRPTTWWRWAATGWPSSTSGGGTRTT